MPTHSPHLVELLIRHTLDGYVKFLLLPDGKWRNESRASLLALPTRKIVKEADAAFIQGTSIEKFVDAILLESLRLELDDYVILQEIEPALCAMLSAENRVPTEFTVYPVDVWVRPEMREDLRARIGGVWLSCSEAAARAAEISPTALAVLDVIQKREARLADQTVLATEQRAQKAAGAPVKAPEIPMPDPGQFLLTEVPARPSMDALATKWLSQNRGGVRCLNGGTLNDILDAGSRAFNLRVADPYLRYQLQGLGFTWSFFTHKDKQDCHVHGAPVVEIYGILEGQMELWWKPYYDRGTSAWSHRVLNAGDWAEVDSLHCHIVNWLAPGKGVVFKAGPGPLAEVGRLGIKGKTTCENCVCMKPSGVISIENKHKQ